jgi:hypothetical protein
VYLWPFVEKAIRRSSLALVMFPYRDMRETVYRVFNYISGETSVVSCISDIWEENTGLQLLTVDKPMMHVAAS